MLRVEVQKQKHPKPIMLTRNKKQETRNKKRGSAFISQPSEKLVSTNPEPNHFSGYLLELLAKMLNVEPVKHTVTLGEKVHNGTLNFIENYNYDGNLLLYLSIPLIVAAGYYVLQNTGDTDYRSKYKFDSTTRPTRTMSALGKTTLSPFGPYNPSNLEEFKGIMSLSVYYDTYFKNPLYNPIEIAFIQKKTDARSVHTF